MTVGPGLYLLTACHHDSTNLGIIVHLIESCDQLVHQTSTESIESLGTVEGDKTNTTIST